MLTCWETSFLSEEISFRAFISYTKERNICSLEFYYAILTIYNLNALTQC